MKERVQSFDFLMKFILKKRLFANSLVLFLKSNEIVPFFDAKLLNSQLSLAKMQSCEEFLKSSLHKKSQHSADMQFLRQTGSENTNIVSLGEKTLRESPKTNKMRTEESKDCEFSEKPAENHSKIM